MKTTINILLIATVVFLSACAQGPKKETETVFYPMPPQTPRVQFLTSITREDDLGTKSNFREFLLGEKPAAKTLARPNSIAHEKGKIYIADKTARKVIIVDLDKRIFDYIKDIKGGELILPSGIFITDDHLKYVADSKRGQIVVYNEKNEFHRAYGAVDQFRPTDVVVYGNKIYVCDIDDNEIEVLDKQSGKLIKKIGERGNEEGRFNKPTHLAIDKEGNLFVTDAFNFRIQMFDKNENFIKTIGYQGSHPGSFGRPKGIDTDNQGHLYTVDASFELIQIFDIESTEPLLSFGKYGAAPGSTYLPAGIHIDHDNVNYFNRYVDDNFKVEYLIYVGNLLGNNKLNVYGFGEWIGEPLHYIPKPKPKLEPALAPAGK